MPTPSTPSGATPSDQPSPEPHGPHESHEPRLTVGIISAGAVGTALAETFSRAGHHVHGVNVHSERSAVAASKRIPTIPQLPLEQVAQAALVILAVPDPQLPTVIEEVAQHTQDGQMVAHTSGAFGCDILQPITDTGALPLALHPAMAFTGSPVDTERLTGCAWGITADSDQGLAVAELLVTTVAGVPIAIAEDKRPAYHAAMAHAGNHTVTLINDALRIMDYVLDGSGATGAHAPGGQVPHNPDSAMLLRRLALAAVDNALESRMDQLTGPVARDDAPAVLRHIAALEELSDGSAGSASFTAAYTTMAERTAQMRHAIEVERVLADKTMGIR